MSILPLFTSALMAIGLAISGLVSPEIRPLLQGTLALLGCIWVESLVYSAIDYYKKDVE